MMSFGQRMAAVMGMTDAVWARHANPWSVWTRLTALPLLILAAWSRVWLDWWALAPAAAAITWTWLNPRLFRPPRSTRNWASKATFGERVWLNRKAVPIPERHLVLPHLLNGINGAGVILILWGVLDLAVWPTLLGCALSYGGKLWFVDRMVWLYEDMKDATPEYRSWLR